MAKELASIEIEKCWVLGQVFCDLRDRYLKKDFRDPKKRRDFLRYLYSAQSLCEGLSIKTKEVLEFLESIKKEANLPSKENVSQPLKLSKEDFNGQLEPALDAALRGKNPYYSRVFGVALNSQELRFCFDREDIERRIREGYPESRFKDLMTEFDRLRYVLPKNEYVLVWSVLETCDNKWNQWQKNYENSASEIGVEDLANKIRGLITGSLKAVDLLETQDRIQWIIVSVVSLFLLGGGVFLILLAILNWVTFRFFVGVSFPLDISTSKNLLDVLNNILTFLGTIGVATAAFGHAVKKLWDEIRDDYALRLARRRLLNPKAKWLI